MGARRSSLERPWHRGRRADLPWRCGGRREPQVWPRCLRDQDSGWRCLCRQRWQHLQKGRQRLALPLRGRLAQCAGCARKQSSQPTAQSARCLPPRATHDPAGAAARHTPCRASHQACPAHDTSCSANHQACAAHDTPCSAQHTSCPANRPPGSTFHTSCQAFDTTGRKAQRGRLQPRQLSKPPVHAIATQPGCLLAFPRQHRLAFVIRWFTLERRRVTFTRWSPVSFTLHSKPHESPVHELNAPR